MQLFIRITAVYFACGMVFTLAFRADPMQVLGDFWRTVPGTTMFLLTHAWWAMIPFAALFWMMPRATLLARVPRAMAALFACAVFCLTFNLVKTTLPHAMPFWADPMLARLDRALHFGRDPWRLTHEVMPWVNAAHLQRIYIGLWTIPALCFPVFLVLFDGNEARIRRNIIVYAFGWIGLGNVLALGLMSAGPVYYDRLQGSAEFTALTEALVLSGIADSSIGETQEWLWDLLLTQGQATGSGISAFPSVHVALATVICLYIAERWRPLVLPMVALIAAYQVLSVHLGWHYAVDGYASILAILALRAWLRKPRGAADPFTAQSA